MSNLSRRKLLATAAGASGLAVAAKLADQYGLIPPQRFGLYGPGESLTYAAQRLLTRHSMAREFPRAQISKTPFANELGPLGDDYKRLQGDWRLGIDGMVARPGSLSLAELKSFPSRSQITGLACEEGWSFIAEWTGVTLSQVMDVVGISPKAKWIVYSSIQRGWRDSIDMADALHPQTILTYGMNGGELPVGHGGPLRMRVPRQLGYKSVKFIAHLKVTDNPKDLPVVGDYSWYAGI